MNKTRTFATLLVLQLTVVAQTPNTPARASDVLAQSASQSAFNPFPDGIASHYHFDLARNFFRSPDEEAAARRLLISRLEQFRLVASALPRSAVDLLHALQEEDSLLLEVTRHSAYLELRYYSDTRNADAQQASGTLRSLADQALSVFDNALVSRPDSYFARMEKVEPALRRYRFAIANARRAAAHRLTPDGERALTALGPMARGGGAQLFFATLNATDFGVIKTSSGPLSVARDYSAIATNPDGRVRREGYLLNEEGLAQQRDVYADILVRTATALNAAARLRRYADYSEESYGDRFLDRAQVISFLNSLAAHAEINKRIERAVRDHIVRFLASTPFTYGTLERQS
jgi:oligoendopeptidase F